MSYPERRKGRLTGKWIAEFKAIPGDTVTRKRTFATMKEAVEFEDTFKATGAPPNAPKGAAVVPVVTFGQAADACRDAGGSKGKWHRGRDVSVIQRLADAETMLGKNTPLVDITTETLDRMVATLRKRRGKKAGATLSLQTINNYLIAVSAVLKFAQRRKMLPGYVAPEVPKQSVESRALHWLTRAAEERVCAEMTRAGHPSSTLVVRVLAATGMRWGEFEALELGQIEDAWVHLWKTKTDAPRSIPIDDDTARKLRALVGAGGAPNYDTFREHLKAALKSAGENTDASVHSLRHSSATRWILAGVPVPIVQKFLGHKNIETTMRYVHIADEQLTEALEKVSRHAGFSGGKVCEEPAHNQSQETEFVEELETADEVELAASVSETDCS